MDLESSDWGKEKYDYYHTDYVDKDYPSKLNRKEERAAEIEQEEALRLQKRLYSTINNIDINTIIDENGEENLIEFIENQNKNLVVPKKVSFQEVDDDDSESQSDEEDEEKQIQERQRRPISMAIKKNRGLTPYKKKEYRNPRIKHKKKYERAISKRRRLVKEVQSEYHRYSGESTGIKTSTIKSIKLC